MTISRCVSRHGEAPDFFLLYFSHGGKGQFGAHTHTQKRARTRGCAILASRQISSDLVEIIEIDHERSDVIHRSPARREVAEHPRGEKCILRAHEHLGDLALTHHIP